MFLLSPLSSFVVVESGFGRWCRESYDVINLGCVRRDLFVCIGVYWVVLHCNAALSVLAG